MKKVYLFATLVTLFFAGLNSVSAQNFRVLSNTILTTNPLECDTIAVDVLTYLGCINFVNNGYTYAVNGNTINIDVKYTSSPICFGALSQPMFNVKMVGIPAGTYTISSDAYLDNVLTNSVTTPITVGQCCPATSQIRASFFMSDSAYCVGDTFYLNNLSINATTYEWFKNNVAFSTNTNPIIIASNVGINTIRLKADSGFCTDDTTLQYRVNANPIVDLGIDTIICQGASITLSPMNTFASYFWQDSTTLDSLVVNSAGYYSVSVIDTNGCKGQDTVLVGVSVCTFANELSTIDLSWSIYPNPAQESISITLNDAVKTSLQYKISDLNGRLIKEGTLTPTNLTIETQNLQSGTYIIQLFQNNRTTTKKLTIK
jgi:hypothetical protein